MNLFYNDKYEKTLKILVSLTKLFSENSAPFLHYRIMENLFCECFNAINLSRSDTAYDAKINKQGIGLKTFLCPNNHSVEKIAEFNKESKNINKSADKRDLALQLATLRNNRIDLGNNLYGIDSGIYHIIARRESKLILFESDYDKIDINNIQDIKKSDTSLQFNDGKNFYNFNYSKSVLLRRFYIPKTYSILNATILENPFDILRELNIINHNQSKLKVKGVDYVVLPLYSMKKNEKYITSKSGLNQWAAQGRKRNPNEVYIQVPSIIHKKYPNFFPNRDTPFILQTPLNENLNVKLCQDGSKALMSNPNSALSNWLLRKILKLKEYEILTMDKLYDLGFDSVIVSKNDKEKYSIDIMPLGSYEEFIEINK